MKKLFLFVLIAVFFTACEKPVDVASDQMMLKSADKCTTIQSGKIMDSEGNVITTGYMENGYNYQAHMYNGEYSPGWKLVMKWNDAWLSNQDCDGDGLLDRPLDENGNQYYFGSGAWCTNHWTNTYTDDNGNECIFDEFIKIVAVPEGSYIGEPYETDYWGDSYGTFYTADGEIIGRAIWGQFAIIQHIVNDPCGGVEGIQYKSPDHTGLGNR